MRVFSGKKNLRLLVFLLFVGCHSVISKGNFTEKINFPESLLHRKFNVQCVVVDSLYGLFYGHDKDSVRVAYERMQHRAEQEGDAQLYYLLRLSLFQFNLVHGVKDPSLKNSLMDLIKEFGEKKFVFLEAEAKQLLADIFWEEKKYSSALENYLFAYDLYSPLSAEDFPYKANYLYNIGLRYYHFTDFETAKKYFLETWRTIPAELIDNHPSKLNTLALCYGNLEKLDSSDYYYAKAMKAAEESKDEVWIGIICGNLGRNYLKEKRYEEAIPLMERNIEINTRKHQMIDLIFSLSNYAELMLIKKEYNKALELVLRAYDIIQEKGHHGYHITYRVYPILARAFAATGDMGRAFLYMDSAYVARDSFLTERNAVFVSGVQHKIDMEKHKTEISKREEEVRRQKLFLYILVAGILVMFLLAAMFFIQQRKIKQTHLKLIQSEKLAALGQLSASVAHEVNTPLGGIKSSAEEALNSFEEIQKGLYWVTETLSEEEKNLFFRFIAAARPVSVALSTREERDIKKNLREKFSEMGVENARFLSERLVQVGIYEVGPELEKLGGIPHFEKMILLAFNLFNQQHSNRTIVTAVDKASRIVKAMKTYIHSANSDKMEEINLRDNIETVLTIYQNRLKLGVQVIKNYEEAPRVVGYPDQLNQVWTNLVVNAVQAMDNKGILTVGIKQDGNNVLVTIKDTGKGIPAAIQNKVFSAFFTTKQSGEGSGLGLHIINRIVKDHSGTIRFESIEGEGTTFFVSLPGKT